MADAWGVDNLVTHLGSAGISVPPLLAKAVQNGGFYRDGRFLNGSNADSDGQPALSAGQLRAKGKVILQASAATLLDTGDGIGLLELHTKMNCIQPEVLEIIDQTLPLLGTRLKGLIIGNDDQSAFSVGADLRFIMSLLESGQHDALSAFIDRGQKVFLGLRQASVPVVAAVHGFVLGGGCEMALHADRIVAHAEVRMALPEVSVGLIPAWGGCTTMLARGLQTGLDSEQAAQRAATIIFGGAQSDSAEAALQAGILAPDDRLVMHRDLLLPTARGLVIEMIEGGYTPPEPMTLTPPATLDLSGLAPGGTDYDGHVLRGLAGLWAGQPRSDIQKMQHEKQLLFQLIDRPETRARMEHMLATGKPLRN